LSIEIVIDTSSNLQRRLDEGTLDLAVMQAEAGRVRPGDVVLWTDRLCWISSEEWTYTDGPVPLVTFGDDCFYRPIATRALADAGITSSAPFSAVSTAGVIAGVEAGFGVALLGRRSVGGAVIEWPRSGEVVVDTTVCQVARTPDDSPPAEVAELISELERGLAEPALAR
jgi:DNA-binding transcriptional LysR family regulator